MKRDYLVITGANGQLGSFLARYPGLQIYPQLLLYHDRSDRLEDLDDNHDRLIRSCDLLDAGALEKVMGEANAYFQAKPSRLIHTAAIRSSDALSVADLSAEIFSNTMSVNLFGALNILRVMLKPCLANVFGRLVFLTSSVTATGLAHGAAYAAAKAAIANLVKSAALENADQGILINCISPSPIDTDLNANYSGEYLKFREQYFTAYLAKSPTHKLVSMRELAALSVLLLDEALENLTGQEIFVNGGSQ